MREGRRRGSYSGGMHWLRPVTEVPDVTGLGATDACEVIRAAGLKPRGPDGKAPPTSGVVTMQRPIGTAGTERGSPVFLWTSDGEDRAHDLVTTEPGAAELDPA